MSIAKNHNSTAVTINSITLAEAAPRGHAGGANHAPVGPTTCTINFMLPDSNPANAHAVGAHAADANELSFVMFTKVPGGADAVPGAPAPNNSGLRLFKLTAKPKLESATVTDHPDGSKSIQLTLILPSKPCPNTNNFSDLERHSERTVAVENSTTDLSESEGIRCSASTDGADGDTKLLVSFRHR